MFLEEIEELKAQGYSPEEIEQLISDRNEYLDIIDQNKDSWES